MHSGNYFTLNGEQNHFCFASEPPPGSFVANAQSLLPWDWAEGCLQPCLPEVTPCSSVHTKAVGQPTETPSTGWQFDFSATLSFSLNSWQSGTALGTRDDTFINWGTTEFQFGRVTICFPISLLIFTGIRFSDLLEHTHSEYCFLQLLLLWRMDPSRTLEK